MVVVEALDAMFGDHFDVVSSQAVKHNLMWNPTPKEGFNSQRAFDSVKIDPFGLLEPQY